MFYLRVDVMKHDDEYQQYNNLGAKKISKHKCKSSDNETDKTIHNSFQALNEFRVLK